MKKKDEEYENFDSTVRGLLRVSHNEIKGKLDKEKAAKKRKKIKTSPVSREAGDR